jgi:hypothetical protein
MNHFIFRYYILIAFIGGLIAMLAVIESHHPINWQLVLTVVGGIFSFIYFIQKQKLEETRLFNDLFLEFNKRYDCLNEKLNDIVVGSENISLSLEEINDLYDYFNLCGEEYFFYKQGYIFPDVWKSWLNGMKFFYSNKRIRKIWDKELESNSYYGLRIES